MMFLYFSGSRCACGDQCTNKRFQKVKINLVIVNVQSLLKLTTWSDSSGSILPAEIEYFNFLWFLFRVNSTRKYLCSARQGIIRHKYIYTKIHFTTQSCSERTHTALLQLLFMCNYNIFWNFNLEQLSLFNNLYMKYTGFPCASVCPSACRYEMSACT